jgi:hypothetical protein
MAASARARSPRCRPSSTARRPPMPAEKERRASLARELGRVRDAQAEGRVPADLDPGLLVLAELAIAAYPLVFAQVARMLVDVDVDDPAFQRTYAEFLRRLGERLGLAGGARSAPADPSVT